MSDQEEEQKSLEEIVEEIKQAGSEDPKEIAQRIYEEDVGRFSTTEVAKALGIDTMDVNRIKGNVVKRLKAGTLKKEGEGDVSPPPPGRTVTEAPTRRPELTDRQKVIYYGTEGLAEIKRRVLEESLKSAPGSQVTKAADWVLLRWDRNPIMHDDPRELYDVLRNAGVPDRISNEIVADVFAVEDKYSEELRLHYEQPPGGFMRRPRFGEEFGGYRGPTYSGRPGPGGYGYSRAPTYDQWGYPVMYPPYYPERGRYEDTEEIVRRVLREDRERREPREPEPQVEIVTPLKDTEGKVIHDSKGQPIYTTIRGPASSVAAHTAQPSSELSTIRTLKELGIVRVPGTEQHIDVEAVIEEATKPFVQKIGNLEQKMDQMKDETTRKERERLEKELGDTRKDMRDLETRLRSELSSRSGEYKEDSYRLIGTGMNRMADALEGRKPVERIADLIFGEGRRPPVREAEKGARAGLISELERAGYVVRE